MATMTFYGHAAVGLEADGTTILIDPYFTDNPQATMAADDAQADFIVVTHAHGDHIGDAVEIAKRTGAIIAANFEIANFCEAQGCEVCPMHIGGSVDFPFGRIKLTQAFHGSTIEVDGKPVTLGMPAGVIVSLGGKHVYHAGDTGLFGDMKLVGEDVPLDLSLLPIGGRFTMDVKDAVKAAGFLKQKLAVPIHYNTWPPIKTDPAQFVTGCEEAGMKAQIVAPGESIEV